MRGGGSMSCRRESMSKHHQQGRSDMGTMFRLGVLCAVVSASAVTASAAPMGAGKLQIGSPLSDVLRVYDPDERAYSRTLHHWHRSPLYRYLHARDMRMMRYMHHHRGRR